MVTDLTWPTVKFNVIYMDPPWQFLVRSDKGKGRSAERHYSVMTFKQLAALPILDLAAEDCALCMWVTDPMLKHGMQLLERWDFEFKTVLFYWAKVRGADWHIGTGYYTRANPEQCWVAVPRSRHAPTRVDRSVRRLIVSELREHSRKPDEAYTRIEQLWGDVTRIELFARTQRPGWTAWGSEVSKYGA